MNRVFVRGDTHCNALGEMKNLNTKNFPEGNDLDKQDYLIIVGDFGFIFHNQQTKEEKYWLNWLKEKPWTTLFIDGNHDNHPKLAWLKRVDMFGDKVGYVNDSVFYLRRSVVYTIANRTFFCLGGAFSIDQAHRREGIDWWPQEEPNYHETKRAYTVLDDVGWKVDYVLTHDAPSWVRDALKSHHMETSYTVRLLDDIFGKRKFEFKHHYFGHHHMNKTVMEKHTCCYNKIHELD
jgi:DNA repair exonuclease SbcCD nuclease subunit